MTDIDWTPIKVKLGDLAHWAENPVTLSKAQARKLLTSTEKLGRMQTLAIGPSNGNGKHPLYDGHQRASVWAAAFGLGLEVNALESSRPLNDDERHAVPIMLRTATGSFDWQALAGWDTEKLSEWGMDADLLNSWNTDGVNLKEMLQAEQPEPQDAEPQVDRAEELNQKWQVVAGDLWRIGEHRLLCGDSTKREDVSKLMGDELSPLVVTDPPYGVAYADKNKFLNAISRANRVETPIVNDHESKDDTQKLWRSAFAEMSRVMCPGAVVYCFMPQGGDQMMMMMMMMMMGAGIEPKHELIWLKNNHVLGRVDYAYKHEPILYAWKEGGHKFYGDFQTSILEFNRPQVSEFHPTTKPVALIERLISNSSKSGEIVFDPFCGSGTTIVACQNLSRKCRAIEISPNYCAVTLERMSTAFPDLVIERVSNA